MSERMGMEKTDLKVFLDGIPVEGGRRRDEDRDEDDDE